MLLEVRERKMQRGAKKIEIYVALGMHVVQKMPTNGILLRQF